MEKSACMGLTDIVSQSSNTDIITLSTYMHKGQIKLLVCKNSRHHDQEDVIFEIALTDETVESLVDNLLHMLRYKKLDSAFVSK